MNPLKWYWIYSIAWTLCASLGAIFFDRTESGIGYVIGVFTGAFSMWIVCWGKLIEGRGVLGSNEI